MAVICPTLLAYNTEEYKQAVERVAFAPRVQVDLMDGVFAPTKSIGIGDVYWNENQIADIHLMYKQPTGHIDALIALKPKTIILHAESDGDIESLLLKVKSSGISAGLCVLPETSVESVKGIIKQIEHLLIFGGKLGYNGGKADLSQLEKAGLAKAINPDIEIGWDGGANIENAREMQLKGVDVINVGGGIHAQPNPEVAYRNILASVQ
ncbi:hypothetical protein KBC31_03460 [Candidatus Saccharibacteria bacterium]|jgi:ribulose-phosphate 3-epimerase|nr:hypothetical protein [Candidatus Saccharibacteria bacterium]